MGVLWEDEAWQEYIDWQEQDKKMLKKINRLIRDILRNPFDGIRHPEPLSGNLSGGGADILTRRTVLYTKLQKEIQRFFHVKIITTINNAD